MSTQSAESASMKKNLEKKTGKLCTIAYYCLQLQYCPMVVTSDFCQSLDPSPLGDVLGILPAYHSG
jgi:hypothetical protein